MVNAVNAPSSAAIFLLPLVGIILGWRLPGIVLLLVSCRLLALITQCWVSFRCFPFLRMTYRIDIEALRSLIGFGGWITGSNILIPLFVYVDRFFIGTLLPIKALAYYSVPRDLTTRLGMLPAALGNVLFPAFSTLASNQSQHRLRRTLARSTKYILASMVLPTVVLILFAEDILIFWLGNDFAAEGTDAFRLLVIAFLFNSVGFIVRALIEGIGRPDILTKLHLVELPIYFGLTYVLIGRLGITGAALAWCLRTAWNIPILFLCCTRIAKIPSKVFSENGTSRSFVTSAILVVVTIIALPLLREYGFAITTLVCAALLTCYGFLLWLYVFDYVDKEFTKNLLQKFHNA